MQIAKIAAVIAFIGIAAAFSTPKGRLPLAIRGMAKAFGRPVSDVKGETVPIWKRVVAMALVVLSIAIVMWKA